MTQVVLNISNKKDLPLIRSLSKRMGWTISRPEAMDEPNETTLAAMREVESGAELEDFDLDGLRKMVAGF